MNRFVFLFLLLQTLPVLADPPAAEPNPVAAPTPHDRLGRPQICDRFLPPGTSRLPALSITLASVHIMQTGEVRGISLLKSSGNDALDNAALNCLSSRNVGPIKQDGNKIEGDEVIGVYWYPTWSTYAAASPSGALNLCNVNALYPPYAIRNHEQGDTKVTLRIATDGSVKKVSMTESSGFVSLDNATIDCVSAWRFYPVGQNGQAVEVDREYQIRWRLFP